jgi:hypothetical protein
VVYLARFKIGSSLRDTFIMLYLIHDMDANNLVVSELRTFASLVTSSTGKRGSLSARAGQTGPERRSGHRMAHHRSPALHWYLLTYRV